MRFVRAMGIVTLVLGMLGLAVAGALGDLEAAIPCVAMIVAGLAVGMPRE
jgi:hypothetical protein